MTALSCPKSARAILRMRIRTVAGRACLSLGVVLLVALLPSVSGLDLSAERAGPQRVQNGALFWQSLMVDSAAEVGTYTSLALDSAGQPWISYYDSQGDALKLAHHDGTSWQIEEVDGSGGTHTSLALDSSDRPHISYCSGPHLKHAYHDGSVWILEPVESLLGGSFGATSLALDSAGRPHISYDDLPRNLLKYAYDDGSEWQILTVDPYTGPGAHNSLALDAADRPHISYHDNGSLMYATRPESQWQIAPVDSQAVGDYNSLALDSAGRPHISYYQAQSLPLTAGVNDLNYNLKYAHFDGTAWQKETVDSVGDVGKYSSIALGAAGNPKISYYDETNGALRYAFYGNSAWQAETVDGAGDVGLYTSLVMDASGQPHISYYDNGGHNLMYASDLAIGTYGRAAQLLEEVRGTPMAPGWDMARLGSDIQPLYRPDMEGVAYYEFPVEVPPAAIGLPNTVSGFIIVSTADHDFATPHWNYEGLPPTQQMAGKAAVDGTTAAKSYKLDALAYAAEDAAGALVATLGTQPLKVSGMDPAWLDQPGIVSEESWIPDPSTDDSNIGNLSGKLTKSGPAPPPSLQMSPWGSWAELKDGYAASYGVLTEALHREAAEQWQLLSQISQLGEDLYPGDVRLLAMLWPSPTVTLSGRGESYVLGELVDRPGLPPVYQVTVQDASPGEALALEVNIGYANGVTEQVKYRIVSGYLVRLPYVARIADEATMARVQTPKEVDGAFGWGPWRFYLTGEDPYLSQRWYKQIVAGSPPNTSSCASGYAATAWANLFGWADARAATGNPYWAPRWGLYRANGGKGADAVAPQEPDAGVNNMIWEIRNDIQTLCLLESGLTWTWEMGGASKYLVGRTGTSLTTYYSVTGLALGSIRNRAADSIQYRDTPAVIGSGWLQYYLLAHMYGRRELRFLGRLLATDHKFYVNGGQGNGLGTGWTSTNIWFVGEIRP